MSLNVREDVEVKLFHLNLLKNVKSFENNGKRVRKRPNLMNESQKIGVLKTEIALTMFLAHLGR